MPANSRWDLIRGLKGSFQICLRVCWWDSFVPTHIHIFPQIPLHLFIQPQPPSVLSTYLCQFSLPPFFEICYWRFAYVFLTLHSFQLLISKLRTVAWIPVALSIIIVIHYSSSYQFLSTWRFPSACDVLLRYFIQFGSIITLVWFHLFYLHTDVFFNDIEFTSVSVFRSPFRFVLICLAKLHLHIRSVSFH